MDLLHIALLSSCLDNSSSIQSQSNKIDSQQATIRRLEKEVKELREKLETPEEREARLKSEREAALLLYNPDAYYKKLIAECEEAGILDSMEDCIPQEYLVKYASNPKYAEAAKLEKEKAEAQIKETKKLTKISLICLGAFIVIGVTLAIIFG